MLIYAIAWCMDVKGDRNKDYKDHSPLNCFYLWPRKSSPCLRLCPQPPGKHYYRNSKESAQLYLFSYLMFQSLSTKQQKSEFCLFSSPPAHTIFTEMFNKCTSAKQYLQGSSPLCGGAGRADSLCVGHVKREGQKEEGREGAGEGRGKRERVFTQMTKVFAWLIKKFADHKLFLAFPDLQRTYL